MQDDPGPSRAETLIPCALLVGVLALIGTLGFLAGHAVGSDSEPPVAVAAAVTPTGPAVVFPVEPTTAPTTPTATREPTPTAAPPTPTPRWTPSNAPTRNAGEPCGPDALRCIQLGAVTRNGDLLTIEWLAHGFSPEVAGGHHAHFYWDIYAPAQAGNNAAAFGVAPGSWDAVDAQPYVKDLSTMPDGATAFCVTVGTPIHGVDDPSHAECAPIPEN